MTIVKKKVLRKTVLAECRKRKVLQSVTTRSSRENCIDSLTVSDSDYERRFAYVSR
jgi:hypothetical protein